MLVFSSCTKVAHLLLTLKLLITTIVVLEGYTNSKTCPTYDTPDATIQTKCPYTGRNLLSYKHTALQYKVRCWILPTLIKTKNTQFQAASNFRTHFVSFITIFWKKKHPWHLDHFQWGRSRNNSRTYICHLFLSALHTVSAGLLYIFFYVSKTVPGCHVTVAWLKVLWLSLLR